MRTEDIAVINTHETLLQIISFPFHALQCIHVDLNLEYSQEERRETGPVLLCTDCW